MAWRAAAGPRRTLPRSTALRTATGGAAPVAEPKHRHPAVGLSPGLPLPHRAAAGLRHSGPVCVLTLTSNRARGGDVVAAGGAEGAAHSSIKTLDPGSYPVLFRSPEIRGKIQIGPGDGTRLQNGPLAGPRGVEGPVDRLRQPGAANRITLLVAGKDRA